MCYRTENCLPTRDIKNSIVSLGQIQGQEKKKFFLYPSSTYKLHRNQTVTFLAGHVEKRCSLRNFEHLLIGISALAGAKRIRETEEKRALAFQESVITALTVAIEGGIPIAHYYMAEALSYFEGDKSKEAIKDHYKKAFAAKDASPSFIDSFNHYVEKLENIDPQHNSFQGVMTVLSLTYRKVCFKDFTNPQLLQQAESSQNTEEKGERLHALACRYRQEKEDKGTLKFSLAAACFDHSDALQFIAENKIEYPDLKAFLRFIKPAVLSEHSLADQLKFLEAFDTLYKMYQYLYAKKDTSQEKDKKNQDVRQTVFMMDLQKLARNTLQNPADLKTHIEETGKKYNLVAVDYAAGFYKGSEAFQQLRQQLVSLASINDQLSKAANCFIECLQRQLLLEGSFANTLFSIAADKLEFIEVEKPPAANFSKHAADNL